ncbi:GAUT3 [Symbiodinium sp. CCMP2592]|nr:GAUT3 [Symbiodinium sp. CCMP2592]
MLAKQCVAMGVDLEDIDVYGQTPLFWAASRGNMLVVQFLFQLGFEVNFRDYARKTALFFAIENSHLDVADYLIERAASTKVQSNQKKTPQALLKAINHKPPQRKRKLASPTPTCVCPGATTRSHFAKWEWAQAQEESEPLIERSEDNVVLESHQYFVCSNARGCSKRLRCSELEFAADHAHLHQDTMWYRSLTTEQAEAFVHVNADEEQARLKVIEEMATGGRPSAFTLPAVSQQTHTLAGYVHASFADQTLVIKHCKVDRPHQGRGLGGLLIQAAEKHAQKLGAAISTVKLSVLETNEPARKCYAKSGFQYCGESPSIFPPCNCPADSCHCANKIKWLSMEKRAPAISSSPSLLPPPALPEAVGLKWQRLLGSRGLKVDEQPLPKQQEGPLSSGAGAVEATLACLRDSDGFAHVALSADLAQIDGLIVTLQSAVTSAANASSLCFHAFVLPQQKDFVIEGLRCAFAETLVEDGAGRGLSWPILGAFRLHGRSQLILHGLNPDHIWAEVGMNSTGVRANHSASAIMLGETDLSNSLRSDTGNLGAVHNFARFSLHTLLPGLSRVVYLDVDVVVKGDLAELYNVTMSTVNGAPGTVAAVQRSNQPLRTYVDVLQPAVPSWLPSEAPSFNAGVMVIDLARWRQRHASRLVAEWIEMNSRRRLWLHGSQPPLLLLFHDEVVSLHWSWNVDGLGHRLNYPKHVLAEAKVLHWTGPLKPWRHHGVNRKLWEPHTREYCPKYSNREHTTTCRPDSWFC